MPTPAEILLENSSLDSGTPWDHLNNQLIGSGTGIILHDGLELLMNNTEFELTVDTGDMDIELEPVEYTVEDSTEELILEI